MSLPLLAIGFTQGAPDNRRFTLMLLLQDRTLSLTPTPDYNDILPAVLACTEDVITTVNRPLKPLYDGNVSWLDIGEDEFNLAFNELTRLLNYVSRPSMASYPRGPSGCDRVPVPYMMTSVEREDGKITIGYEIDMHDFRANLACLRKVRPVAVRGARAA